MKLILTIITILFVATFGYAQIVFSADFEDETFGGMTMVDNDGLTTDPGVALFSDAWTLSNPFFEEAFDITSKVAISNSRYTPAGTADDWLISPAMTIVESGTAVLWNARALGNTSHDGMEVRVSTTDNNILSFTDIIYSSEEESPELTQRSASLNDYTGQQIYIAFVNNSTDKYLLMIDDIVVKPLDAVNASIISFATEPYQLKNQDISIAVNVMNKGGFELNSLDLKWTDGVNEHEETITGLTLKTGESTIIASSSSYVATEHIVYPLEITITNPNNEQDVDISDNTISAEISGISYIPNRKVVGEEGTGTWCGWCPAGTVALDSMETFFKDDFIGIAVHNSDPMEVAEYDDRLGFQGFPGGKINRKFDIAPSDFRLGLERVKQAVSPLAIDLVATGNLNDRTVLVKVSTESITQLVDKDYRMSVIITEDNVTGTSPDYDQINNFSGLELGLLVGVDGVDWSTLPDPVLAADMEYDHVARAILGGFDGLSGSIPSNLSSGDISTEEFSWVVPTTTDISELDAIALVLDNTTGEIINAEKSEIEVVTSTNDNIDNARVNIYPNPANQKVLVDISLKKDSEVNLLVLNGMGEVVSNEKLGRSSAVSFKYLYDVSKLSEGIYVFKISIDGVVTNKKIIVLNN